MLAIYQGPEVKEGALNKPGAWKQLPHRIIRIQYPDGTIVNNICVNALTVNMKAVAARYKKEAGLEDVPTGEVRVDCLHYLGGEDNVSTICSHASLLSTFRRTEENELASIFILTHDPEQKSVSGASDLLNGMKKRKREPDDDGEDEDGDGDGQEPQPKKPLRSKRTDRRGRSSSSSTLAKPSVQSSVLTLAGVKALRLSVGDCTVGADRGRELSMKLLLKRVESRLCEVHTIDARFDSQTYLDRIVATTTYIQLPRRPVCFAGEPLAAASVLYIVKVLLGK